MTEQEGTVDLSATSDLTVDQLEHLHKLTGTLSEPLPNMQRLDPMLNDKNESLTVCGIYIKCPQMGDLELCQRCYPTSEVERETESGSQTKSETKTSKSKSKTSKRKTKHE